MKKKLNGLDRKSDYNEAALSNAKRQHLAHRWLRHLIKHIINANTLNDITGLNITPLNSQKNSPNSPAEPLNNTSLPVNFENGWRSRVGANFFLVYGPLN